MWGRNFLIIVIALLCIGDEHVYCQEITVSVKLKILLQGCYSITDGQMSVNLKTENYLPLTSPYCEDLRSVSSIPTDISDWVLVQLRTSVDGNAVVSKSVFLRRDGRIVADDGTTTIVMNAIPGSYYVVIKHRNHLPVMTASMITLSSDTVTLYDFTIGENKCYGTSGVVEVETGIWAMWAGDINQDGMVTTRDYKRWYESNRVGVTGYQHCDLNFNASVNQNDYLVWLENANKGAMASFPILGNDEVICCLSSNNMDFGVVCIGDTSDKILTITNNGTTTLQIIAISTTNSDFMVIGCENVSIEAGGYLNIKIRFTPTVSMYYNALLQIQINSIENVKNVILSGTGYEAGIQWISVPGGTYTMGNPGEAYSLADQFPIHQVALDTFNLSKYPVTNAQYALFLNEYGSETVKSGEYVGQQMFSECDHGIKKYGSTWVADPGYEYYPMICVTWYGADEYAHYYGLSLPTEAEWENAARSGGTNQRFSGTNQIDSLGEYSWYNINSSNMTHEVGTKKPNSIGLYDMTGNVLEWCSDWYLSDYYSQSPIVNPQGPSSGSQRVTRGGGWMADWIYCLNIWRFHSNPASISNMLGFRVKLPVQNIGDGPVIILSPDSLNFGTVTKDSSSKKVLRISNAGTAELQINDINITNVAFSMLGSTSFYIPAGNYRDIEVWFTPSLSTSYSALLQINNNSIDSIKVIALNGTGVETGMVTDIDGNMYKTVKIGNQWWMAENLKVTRYRNGDGIPGVTNSSTWCSLTTGAYCNYDNNESYVVTYGRVYNWYAVNDSRNIAPEGWHVPSDVEWQSLVESLGGSSIAGGKMKEIGTSHWNAPNAGATNESGFCALAGGLRRIETDYGAMKDHAVFWVSTECNSQEAWRIDLEYNNSVALRSTGDKREGYSIRCIKD